MDSTVAYWSDGPPTTPAANNCYVSSKYGNVFGVSYGELNPVNGFGSTCISAGFYITWRNSASTVVTNGPGAVSMNVNTGWNSGGFGSTPHDIIEQGIYTYDVNFVLTQWAVIRP